MNKKSLILLFSIILLAGILRFWGLGSVPPSPDWDEAALGYSAYSILETGRDEYGEFLPVVLRSFDDYKPALYAYLIIPFIPIFDLSTFTVRFPSALLGTLTVGFTFLLVRELFIMRNSENKNSLKTENWKLEIPMLTALMLAISPWHVQFSRIAFETNTGLAFNILAAYLFLLGLRKPVAFYFSAFVATLPIYAYQSDKVFTPLLFLLLIGIYFKQFINLPKKQIVAFFVVGIISILPMLISITSNKETLMRAQATSIFTEKTYLLRNNIKKLEFEQQRGNKVGELLNNRRFVYASYITAGYLSHYNLNWLFTTGDLKRHKAPSMGLLYIWELPFVLLGIYFLFFGPFSRKTKLLIFGWFLISPIPASVTTGVPHAVRTLNFLPTFQIFSALGIILFLKEVLNVKYKVLSIKLGYFLIVVIGLFAAANFVFYLNQYFVQQNYFYSKDWQYGWKETVDYVKSVEKDYDKVIVSYKEPLDRSYMFFAFYLKYPPEEYQRSNVGSGGFAVDYAYDKYEFRPINWDKDSKLENVLLIGTPFEFPKSITPEKTINYLDGEPAILIWGN